MRKVERISITCDVCGLVFKERASRRRKYCSRKCASMATAIGYQAKRIQKACRHCGKKFQVIKSRENSAHYCTLACKQIYVARSTIKERADKMRGKGTKTKYIKYGGRHLHRQIAEDNIGRPLEEGEIAHHIDGDSLNNDPANITVLPNQAEHCRIHARMRRGT